MKKIPFLWLALLWGSAVYAQDPSNINVTGLNFFYHYRSMPTKPQDPLFFNYGVRPTVAAGSRPAYDEAKLRQTLEIQGQRKIENPTDSDYIITFNVGEIAFSNSRAVQKGSAFVLVVDYTLTPGYRLSRGAERLYDMMNRHSSFSTLGTKTHETGSFKTAAEATAWWSRGENIDVVRRQLVAQVVKATVAEANRAISAAYGFYAWDKPEQLKTMNTKKHSENEAVDKNATALADKLKTLDGTTPLAEEAIAEQLDYFRAIPDRFMTDSKADAKLRYIAYYNLCVAYLLLDRPEEVIPWADRLVANDQFPKDGERFKKEAEKLSVTLSESFFKTRQFDTRPYLDQLPVAE